MLKDLSIQQIAAATSIDVKDIETVVLTIANTISKNKIENVVEPEKEKEESELVTALNYKRYTKNDSVLTVKDINNIEIIFTSVIIEPFLQIQTDAMLMDLEGHQDITNGNVYIINSKFRNDFGVEVFFYDIYRSAKRQEEYHYEYVRTVTKKEAIKEKEENFFRKHRIKGIPRQRLNDEHPAIRKYKVKLNGQINAKYHLELNLQEKVDLVAGVNDGIYVKKLTDAAAKGFTTNFDVPIIIWNNLAIIHNHEFGDTTIYIFNAKTEETVFVGAFINLTHSLRKSIISLLSTGKTNTLVCNLSTRGFLFHAVKDGTNIVDCNFKDPDVANLVKELTILNEVAEEQAFRLNHKPGSFI